MTILLEDSLEFAKEHISKYYDSDFFPKAMEFEAIWHNWDEVKSELTAKNVYKLDVYPPRSREALVEQQVLPGMEQQLSLPFPTMQIKGKKYKVYGIVTKESSVVRGIDWSPKENRHVKTGAVRLNWGSRG